MFSDIFVGFPGKAHDARVFINSGLYLKAMEGRLFESGHSRQIGGVEVGPLLLGDPAYPLLPWVLKPFPSTGNLPDVHWTFNFKQNRTRMGVENAFGASECF